MSEVSGEVICPICGKPSVPSSKWVLNNYGKRYDYLIYTHGDSKHYSNQSHSPSRSFKKGFLKMSLVEVINSEYFRDGLFSTRDAKDSLMKLNIMAQMDSVRDNLYRLAEIGMLKAVRKDRRVYFINAAYSSRLSFVDESLKVILKDEEGDGMFRHHISIVTVRNDKDWPLPHLPYKILGDSDVSFEEINFKARDLTNEADLKTFVIEETPTEKRLLLKLLKPVPPGETLKVRFEYFWKESNRSFFYTSATLMKRLELSFLTNKPIETSALLCASSLDDVIDLTASISKERNNRWEHSYNLKLTSLKAFSVVHFKWK